MELLIGCGHARDRRILTTANEHQQWEKLVTLDMTAEVEPLVVADISKISLPFKDNTFDEIHAYEVLEHVGNQGDWRFFFRQFDEFARILKPYGLLCATSPAEGMWVWGDPGHTRYMGPGVYYFLSRENYELNKGKTPMTEYRPYFKSDWHIVWMEKYVDGGFGIAIRNLK